MSEISALPGEIVSWLSSQSNLSEFRFITEFPYEKKAVPLDRTVVAVGIEKMTITDSFAENGDGVLERQEHCRQADIAIRLTIHIPFSCGGEACYDAFTKIIDCLTFNSDLEITSSGCEDITPDRDTDAFVLPAVINVKADLCPAVGADTPFASFADKELLCGSHIRNTDIHLSPAQLEYLNAPAFTGHYSGTGSFTRSVNVGFRPRAVIICALGCAPFYFSSNDGSYGTFCAFAAGDYTSSGLEITSNGFRLDCTENEEAYGSRVMLNNLGNDYFYVAFR